MSDSIGSVSVEVTPDARNWAERLRAQIRDVLVKVQLDTGEADTKLDVLTGRLDEIGARSPSIKVKADTGEAETKLALLDATAKRVTSNRSMGGLGGFFSLLKDFKSKGIFGGIESGLEGMAKNGSSAAGALAPLAGLLEGFPVILALAATAAIPLVGALGGLALALAAPLAIVAGGGTLFAFLAGFAVKGAMAQQKSIDALSKKVTAAQQSLEQATTKSGKKTAQERLTLATNAYQAALKNLGPQQSKFLKALDGVKSAFKGMPKGALFAPLTAGLDLVAKVLPELQPIIKATSTALTGLLDGLGKSVSGGSFKKFVDMIAKQLGPDITIFGHIAGNVLKGIGGMFLGANQQLSGGLLKTLEKMSAKFANIGQSNGFQRFLTWVKTNGPGIWHDVEQIAEAIGRMVLAAAPLGTAVLKGIGGLASVLNRIPQKDINRLVTGVSGLGPAFGSIIASAPAFAKALIGAFNAVEPAIKFLLRSLGAIAEFFGALASHYPKFLPFAGTVRALGAALTGAGHAADSLAGSLHRIPTSVRSVVSLAGVEGSKAAISELQARLNALHNKKVWVTVALNGAAQASNVRSEIAGLRSAGGPVAKGKVYLVGERGPELFSPASAGRITPHAATQQMLAQTFATPPRPNYKAAANSGPGKYMGNATMMIDGVPFEGYMHAIIEDHLADRAAMGMS